SAPLSAAALVLVAAGGALGALFAADAQSKPVKEKDKALVTPAAPAAAPKATPSPTDEGAERAKMLAFIQQRMREQDRDPNAIETKPAGRGELRGRVVDADGKPVPDALVDAWDWCPGNETHTAADGTFKLEKLDLGRDVEVRFIKEGF